MYPDIPLIVSLVFVLGGFAALAWSSDFFVGGASMLAKALGISPFVIGMVIIGFGTSAPELCVSAMSGAGGHPGLSLGNAYGSCTFNIAVILGVSAMIFPLVVKPAVAFVAGPTLAAIALFSMFLLRDGACTRTEALILLASFAVLLPAYCWFDQKTKDGESCDEKPVGRANAKWSQDPRYQAIVRGRIFSGAWKTAVGLAVLVGSAHVLVWGAVDFAQFIGVSDLVIGLTIVAVGTSLPELASAIASARRGEHEFVLGNIIGSNFFNTLAVVGLATSITPILPPEHAFSPCILTRDLPLVAALSISITLFGVNWRHPKWPGAINRKKAVVWLAVFVVYTVLMFLQETGRL